MKQNPQQSMRNLITVVALGLLGIMSCSQSSQSTASAVSTDKACPALGFSKTDLCLEISPSHNPLTWDADSRFEIKFWRKSEKLENQQFTTLGLQPKVWAMMTCCNSTREGTLAPKAYAEGSSIPGVYDFGPVMFASPGKWRIFVQLYEGSKLVEEVQQDYDVQ